MTSYIRIFAYYNRSYRKKQEEVAEKVKFLCFVLDSFAVFLDEFSGFGMEAQEEHGGKGEDSTHGKYQVQGKYIAKQTVVFCAYTQLLKEDYKNLR